MTKKQKEEMTGVFAAAFHDVVVPVLEDIEGDIKETKEDIKDIYNRLDSIDKKLNGVQERSYEHGDKLDNHEKRIKKLEKVQVAA